jgi:hypothetical protein
MASMSVGANPVAAMPIGADAAPATSTKTPPPKRTTVAVADVVQHPEAR